MWRIAHAPLENLAAFASSGSLWQIYLLTYCASYLWLAKEPLGPPALEAD